MTSPDGKPTIRPFFFRKINTVIHYKYTYTGNKPRRPSTDLLYGTLAKSFVPKKAYTRVKKIIFIKCRTNEKKIDETDNIITDY
jgi:hypothetical protein